MRGAAQLPQGYPGIHLDNGHSTSFTWTNLHSDMYISVYFELWLFVLLLPAGFLLPVGLRVEKLLFPKLNALSLDNLPVTL